MKLCQATPASAPPRHRHTSPRQFHTLDDALMALVELNAAQARASCSSETVGAAQAALLRWVAVLFMIFQAPSIEVA